MVTGNWAILLNLLSVLALSAIVVVTLVSVAVRLRWFHAGQSAARSRRQLLWLLALAPWSIGLAAGFIAIVPAILDWPGMASMAFLHWHHPRQFLLYSWHGLAAAMATVYVMLILARNFLRLYRNGRVLTTLLNLAEYDGKGFYHLDTDTAAAFTAGHVYPRCFITKALLSRLSEEEFSIIKLHEDAHARRFDPAKTWLFQLLADFFPRKTAQELIQAMATVMEQCADEAVASVVPDKSVIAMTLLKARRLAVQPLPQILTTHTFCHYSQDNIEQRIDYLLAAQHDKGFSPGLALLTLASLAVACAMSAAVVHHALEYIVGHS